MVQKQVINTINNLEHPSQLEKLSLGFEFDKTIQQVRQETRVRAMTKK